MNTGKGEVSRDPPLSAEYCVFSAAMDEGLFAVKMSGPLSPLIQPADIWLQVAYGHPRRSEEIANFLVFVPPEEAHLRR